MVFAWSLVINLISFVSNRLKVLSFDEYGVKMLFFCTQMEQFVWIFYKIDGVQPTMYQPSLPQSSHYWVIQILILLQIQWQLNCTKRTEENMRKEWKHVLNSRGWINFANQGNYDFVLVRGRRRTLIVQLTSWWCIEIERFFVPLSLNHAHFFSQE